MQVTLNHYTPLYIAANAIRQCWASQGRSDTVEDVCGPNDKALIDRIGNKFKHASTLEHLVMTWTFCDVSTTEAQLLYKFELSNFSTCTGDTNEFIVTTNVRELQNLQLEDDVLYKLLPASYRYLFELSEH